MRQVRAGGGWSAILYSLQKARAAGGLRRMWRALRARNACKTCALGMGGQRGGMVDEAGRFPEVCKKSVQAMAADLQGRIRPGLFDDLSLESMAALGPRELEAAGRLVVPMAAGPLDERYRLIDWDDALDRVAAAMRRAGPEASFLYLSGRASNEAAFLLQLLGRCWGTNHVNNCSYYCHQASGVGLKSVIGSGTATVVLEDLERADLAWLVGCNPASNHPRLMKALMRMKRRGGRIVVINPLREVGLERFKVPSDWRSMLRATRIADHYLQPHVGGDPWLLAGLAKAVVERDAVDRAFVETHAEGWEPFEARVRALAWDDVDDRSGVARADIEATAATYAASRASILCWAMGITHHVHGVRCVQLLGNLAIARGMLGKPGAGLLPLRGHSNVQGIGSMGVVPKLQGAFRERLEARLGIPLPSSAGLDTLGCLQRAHEGGMRFACCLGGNLYGATPDATLAAEAFARIDTLVHLSTALNTGHVRGRARQTIVLPVRARDEEAQATTQESMFSYVRLSEGGPARHEGPRSEVDVIIELARRLLGDDGPVPWDGLRSHEAIREWIAEVVPGYESIGTIDATHREFQVAGRTFHEPAFATPSSRARVHDFDLPSPASLGPRQVRCMTVRSEGQFNTVVYEEADRYRGQERRDVILMSAADVDAMGLVRDEPVTVRSSVGAMEGILVRVAPITPGNAAMYYPEANVLVPAEADPQSRTPAFRGFPVTIEGGRLRI